MKRYGLIYSYPDLFENGMFILVDHTSNFTSYADKLTKLFKIDTLDSYHISPNLKYNTKIKIDFSFNTLEELKSHLYKELPHLFI